MDEVMQAWDYYVVLWFCQKDSEQMYHENNRGAKTALNGLIILHKNMKERK